jgi:hypothetical protein
MPSMKKITQFRREAIVRWGKWMDLLQFGSISQEKLPNKNTHLKSGYLYLVRGTGMDWNRLKKELISMADMLNSIRVQSSLC